MTLTVRDDEANLFFEFALAGDPEPMFTALGITFEDGLDHDAQAILCIDALQLAQIELAVEIPSDYSLGPGHADLGVTGGDNIRVDGLATTPGLQVSDATQQNTAWLIKKSTLVGGRKGRGRMFVPGAVDGFVSPSGVLDPSYRDSLQTAVENMVAAILGLTGINGITLFHEEEVAGSPIIALTVDNRVATQRRRMRP